MKKAAILLYVIINLVTGCTKNNDEKKFEAEMTAKADDFIQWYFDAASKASEENEDFNFDPESLDLTFVRLGVENKNYVILNGINYDEDREVENQTYIAVNLSEWDSSMPFPIGGPPENFTFFADLTETEDGKGLICEEGCYIAGPSAEIHKGLIFEEATPTSKDLEKMAAFKENLKLNRASKAISSLYGLSEERSFQLSKTILSWKKVSNQRAMTKRDLDHLTVEFAGVKASEIVESFKDLAKGDEARFNNLIERAAGVNEISPEAVKAMIQDAFMR